MNLQERLKDLKALQLPASDFMIVSSGALAIRGIREARDLDVIVTQSLWDELAKRFPVVLVDGTERIEVDNEIEILNPKDSAFGEKSPVPLDVLFKEADVFEGIRFNNLAHLKIIKQAMGRDKDIRDIQLINNYLASN